MYFLAFGNCTLSLGSQRISNIKQSDCNEQNKLADKRHGWINGQME